MSKFDEFTQEIESGVKQLAVSTLKGYKEEALTDTKAFLQDSKEELERWTKLLANKELSENDFEWLVVSRKDVAELYALKQAGLTMVRIDRFKNALINLVIDTAFDVFL